jgi:hypothetical protein
MKGESTATAGWTRAGIDELLATSAGIAVVASARHDDGIGHVDFLLVDLTKDVVASVVDRKDIGFAVPPPAVREAWRSAVALELGSSYRLFFHVYDKSGVSLVAYDRRDFTCESKGQ